VVNEEEEDVGQEEKEGILWYMGFESCVGFVEGDPIAVNSHSPLNVTRLVRRLHTPMPPCERVVLVSGIAI
jgi:hypothetical protein